MEFEYLVLNKQLIRKFGGNDIYREIMLYLQPISRLLRRFTEPPNYYEKHKQNLRVYMHLSMRNYYESIEYNGIDLNELSDLLEVPRTICSTCGNYYKKFYNIKVYKCKKIFCVCVQQQQDDVITLV
jgi:hypothetical protein